MFRAGNVALREDVSVIMKKEIVLLNLKYVLKYVYDNISSTQMDWTILPSPAISHSLVVVYL